MYSNEDVCVSNVVLANEVSALKTKKVGISEGSYSIASNSSERFLISISSSPSLEEEIRITNNYLKEQDYSSVFAIPLTYLNRNQSYKIELKDFQPKTSENLRIVAKLGFYDRWDIHNQQQLWHYWNENEGNKEPIFQIVSKSLTICYPEHALNHCEIHFSSREQIQFDVLFRCLSTDFSQNVLLS